MGQTVQEATPTPVVTGTLAQPPRPLPSDVPTVPRGYGPAEAIQAPGPTAYRDAELLKAREEDPLEALTIADVVASVYSSFPTIEKARLQRRVASGQVLESYGAYDTKLQGYSLSEPTGFYRNFRNGIGVARQTWWGGYVSAGWRIGRGDFQPWYKERETNEAGEFKVAFAQPLLQGRAIDPQRVAVFQASLATRAAEPGIQQAILETSREAAYVFWQWVAAGAGVDAQRELLKLAVERGKQYEFGVGAQFFREVDLIFNNQLIAERTAKAYEMQQKYQSSAIKLSMFLRDEAGRPIVPDFSWVPRHFPVIEPIGKRDLAKDYADAIARRPEIALLRLDARSVQLEQQLACNGLLPRVDLIAEASQDTGTPASSSNDKGQFELLMGIQGEVPIQRRKARGKILQTQAKLQQIARDRERAENKIGIELQDACYALVMAEQVVSQAEAALKASIDTLSRFQFAFEEGYGKIDLIYINMLETKVTETELKLVDAQARWFVALADMQAALALNPLDQAMTIARLPESKRAGPGFLPAPTPVDPEELKKEWEANAAPVQP
ncbi:MAG: TolC family protein [Aureliella sp.]